MCSVLDITIRLKMFGKTFIRLIICLTMYVRLIHSTESVFCGVCICIPDMKADVTKVICNNRLPTLSRIYSTIRQTGYELYIESGSIFYTYMQNQKQFNSLFKAVYKLDLKTNKYRRIWISESATGQNDLVTIYPSTVNNKHSLIKSQTLIFLFTTTPNIVLSGKSGTVYHETNYQHNKHDKAEVTIQTLSSESIDFINKPTHGQHFVFGDGYTMQIVIIVFIASISCFAVFGLCYLPVTLCRRWCIHRQRRRRALNRIYSNDDVTEMESRMNQTL